MNFELACLEDFNEIENLYWNLIDKSKESYKTDRITTLNEYRPEPNSQSDPR